MAKYVILLHFYISHPKTHKKKKKTIKIQDQISQKQNSAEHLHHGILNYR